MIKETARLVAFLVCTTTLCILAVAECAGAGVAPTWAIGLLGTIAGEWLIEGTIRKSRGTE